MSSNTKSFCVILSISKRPMRAPAPGRGDVAEADDVGREGRWPFRQAGLRLRYCQGHLSLPRGREADVPHDVRAGRQDDAALLDERLPIIQQRVVFRRLETPASDLIGNFKRN